MQVSLCTFGEVKIDDHIYCLDVNSPSEKVYKKTCTLINLPTINKLHFLFRNAEVSSLTCAHQVSAQSIPEVVEHTVPVFLHHLRMNVEARIAQLGDFLGQKLNPLGGVAEDDGLIDLKL